jgi:hypothetical protein
MTPEELREIVGLFKDTEEFREIIVLLKNIQQTQASALTLIMLELTETRAIVQTVLGTQGGIFAILGRPEDEVRTELQKALNQVVGQELERVTERIKTTFAEMPKKMQDASRREQ